MSLKDFVDTNGNSGELTRELLERAFETVRKQGVILTCERCGYETDEDGWCGFCGYLNRRGRSR